MRTKRLIDANALKDLRDKFIRGEIHFDDEYDMVDRCPTVDAEVVVRCKDCQKFKTYACRMVASGYNDFCSYGERKDGADAEG